MSYREVIPPWVKPKPQPTLKPSPKRAPPVQLELFPRWRTGDVEKKGA